MLTLRILQVMRVTAIGVPFKKAKQTKKFYFLLYDLLTTLSYSRILRSYAQVMSTIGQVSGEKNTDKGNKDTLS